MGLHQRKVAEEGQGPAVDWVVELAAHAAGEHATWKTEMDYSPAATLRRIDSEAHLESWAVVDILLWVGRTAELDIAGTVGKVLDLGEIGNLMVSIRVVEGKAVGKLP